MRKICFGKSGDRAKFGLIAVISILFIGAPAGTLLAAGSGWSGSTAISPVGQPDPTRGSQLNDVAVNASGQAIAAWDQYSYNNGGGATIGVAVQSGGRWAAPFTISGMTGFSMTPRVAVGADGTMAVSWTYQDPATIPSPQQKIQVAVKPANSSTWTTYDLDSGSMGGVAITQSVPVGVDSNGNVTAAWSLWDGSKHVVKTATKPAGSNSQWSTATALSPLTADGIYPNLAINAAGNVAVVFADSPYYYAAQSGGTAAWYAFRSAADNSWGPAIRVSESMPSTNGYVSNPQVGLDKNGLATVIYMGYGVESTRQLGDGTWMLPQTVLQAPNQVSSYQSIDLGLDQNGNAVVAAAIFDATINVDRASVWVTQGTPDGKWDLQQRITDPSVPVDAYATRVAVSPNGALKLVGWIDHYHGVVQVSKWAGSVWGKATSIGKSTAFSSFQEVLVLDAASDTAGSTAQARAIWKSAKSGTQIYASSYSQ